MTPHRRFLLLSCLLVAWSAPSARAAGAASAPPAAAGSAPRAALTVSAVAPQPAQWPLRLPAAGNIAAWQEAVIGVEGAGGRLAEVLVGVGDRVKRGQLLARLATELPQTELAATQAALAEADANLAEAAGNARRARALDGTDALSAQQVAQLLTAEQTARARRDALRARQKADQLRLAQTRITASDDGLVSVRLATVGAMAQPGQELFRLIRQGRLEWRAELPSADLSRVKPGAAALLTTPGGQQVGGKVRLVGPVVDAQTRNGIVYVDLNPGSDARAGMYARGEFSFGASPALAVPAAAVLQRDGFAVVLRLTADNRVQTQRVTVGRRQGAQVEITSGLAATDRIVAQGAGFLADGDLVRVVPAR